MKTLILNGFEKKNKAFDDIWKILSNELNETESEFELINLFEKKINYCMGCFDCWVKTPGICRINDDGRIIAEKFIKNDTVIILTPITFGGYSSEIKKALDRIICLILPFFRQVNGETHHIMRYDKYPDLIMLGYLNSKDDESENIFKSLVKRNGINFEPNYYGSDIVYKDDTENIIRGKLKSLLENR